MSGVILTIDQAGEFAARQHGLGKTVVTTNGSFDLLHPGHVFLLGESRKLGDILIVGVNSDLSVKGYKGPDRPIEPQDVRARKVAEHADAVFIFDDPNPCNWLRVIRPDIHANAETYGTECVEAPVLKDIGARLHLIPVKKELGSTTEILRKMKGL